MTGAVGCIVLAATLPWPSVVIGVATLAVGAGLRALRVRRPAHPGDHRA